MTDLSLANAGCRRKQNNSERTIAGNIKKRIGTFNADACKEMTIYAKLEISQTSFNHQKTELLFIES